jgi:lipopolysaccharide biosynthesis glycosyltransferase
VNTELTLVSLGDDNYAMPLAVSLFSAVQRLGPQWLPRVYILSDNISEQNKARIGAVLRRARSDVRIEWRQPDTRQLDGIPLPSRYTRATLLRLFAADELPADTSLALLMDSDVVIKDDFGEVWSQPLRGRLLAAVENFSGPTLQTSLPSLYEQLELPPNAGYFNAGMFLVDLQRWRTERITDRVLQFLSEHHVTFIEQDALNAVLKGDWEPLHPRWNVQLVTLDEYGLTQVSPELAKRLQGELLDAPGMLHYTGPRKPWHWRYKGIAERDFFHSLRESGWFSTPVCWVWVASRRVSHWLFRILARIKTYCTGTGQQT